MDALISFFQLHPEITIVGAITLIQIAPIRIDPWVKIARWFKKIILGDMEFKIDRISVKMDNLEQKVNYLEQKRDEMEEERKEDKAFLARTRILRFADELYEGRHHSKEFFDEILSETDRYEQFCSQHPDYKNNKAKLAIQCIKDTYAQLFDKREF